MCDYEEYGVNAYGHWADDGWYRASMEQDWAVFAVRTIFFKCRLMQAMHAAAVMQHQWHAAHQAQRKAQNAAKAAKRALASLQQLQKDSFRFISLACISPIDFMLAFYINHSHIYIYIYIYLFGSEPCAAGHGNCWKHPGGKFLDAAEDDRQGPHWRTAFSQVSHSSP